MGKAATQMAIETESFQQTAKINEQIKHNWGKRLADKAVNELVGCFTDPIIMYPSPWMDTLPDWVKREIPLARMLYFMKNKDTFGTYEFMCPDLDAMAYMYPSSLEFPLSHDWAQIYLYLSTQGLRSVGKKVPEEIVVDELSSDQTRELRFLKAWLYKKKVAYRKQAMKTDKLAMIEVDEKPDTQIPLF